MKSTWSGTGIGYPIGVVGLSGVIVGGDASRVGVVAGTRCRGGGDNGVVVKEVRVAVGV